MKKRISDLLDSCEDDSVELFDSTPLSADRIRELTMSRISPKKKRPRYILGTFAAAAACLGLVFLAGRAFLGTPDGYERQNPDPEVKNSVDVGDERPGEHCGDFFPSAEPDPGAESSANVGDELPGEYCADEIKAVLNFNGVLYYWHGGLSSRRSFSADEDGKTQMAIYLDENGEPTSDYIYTYLPPGFEAVGEISETLPRTGTVFYPEMPKGELQMWTDFEASGTVYANPAAPLVIYVLMTTERLQNAYVRFDLPFFESVISFEGWLYCFVAEEVTLLSDFLEELPEGCVSAGTLHVVGDYLFPSGNLEVNFCTDSQGKYLEGREVFYNPADDSVIYVFEEQSRNGGSYPGWRVYRRRTKITSIPTASDLWGEAAAQPTGTPAPSPEGSESNESMPPPDQLPYLIMVDGTVYQHGIGDGPGVLDASAVEDSQILGYITSVLGYGIPKHNGEANFGEEGWPYARCPLEEYPDAVVVRFGGFQWWTFFPVNV